MYDGNSDGVLDREGEGGMNGGKGNCNWVHMREERDVVGLVISLVERGVTGMNP